MRRAVSWITEISYRRAWIVIAVVALLVLGGAFTFTRIKQELIPDIEFPVITVIAQAPGTQPDEVSESITAPIDAIGEELGSVDSVESTSIAGLSVTIFNFDFGADLDAAEARINSALSAMALGPNVNTTILRFNPSVFPIVQFSLQGDFSQSEIYDIAQTQVAPDLLNLKGVGAVDIIGGALSEVVVTLDRAALLASGLTFEQVESALRENNVMLPSGQIRNAGSTIPVDTIAIYKDLNSIRQIPIRTPGGNLITLADIATIEEGQADSVGINRTGGKPAAGMNVTKEKSANTVDVAHAVTAKLDELEPQLPSGAAFTIFQDQSEFITHSINDVIIEGLIGGALAIIVVFLFLSNWRSTLVTAVSIPLSIIVAVIILDQFGHSLNLMTLGGLTIAIGRVIDDSIVVLENVYRHMAEGERSFAAIINGAREVSIAIVGATATTCAVFLPLGFVGGIIGELFLPFALAVVAALLASLVVAITVIPVLTRFTIANRVLVQPEKKPATTVLGRIYTPILSWALNNRWKTLAVATALFVGSLALVPLLPIVFLPETGEKMITVNVDARPGETQQSVLERAIAVESLLPNLEVKEYQTVITGASSDIAAIGNIITGRAANSASISVELKSGGQSKNEAAKELRRLIASELPDDENISVSGTGGGFAPSGIAVTVSAETDQAIAQLPQVSEQVAEAISGVDEITNVRNNYSSQQRGITVEVDPARAEAAGFTPQEISNSIRNLSTVKTVTEVTLNDELLPLRLNLSSSGINSVATLGAMQIAPGVRLDSVATLSETMKQVSITHVNSKPAASISAEITGEDVGAISMDAQSAVNAIREPDGIDISFGGISEDINEGFRNMLIAIAVSIVLVYFIMALLFGSWLDPFVILFSLPLAVIGAIVALVATGSALSISAMIGVLMLVGIVVTNAIVMLEFVIMLRKERGYNLRDAIVEGAQTRLRPILMTAVAAMLALIPLSIGLTEGALIASDLGRVVIGGLFSSTMLTLVVVPVVYSLVDDLKTWVAHGPLAAPQHTEAQG